MKSLRTFLAIAITAIAIPPASAHHSSAGFAKDVRELTGTVKEFQFRNPHSWIQMEVPDASGKIVEWSVEWGSPNQLGREGIRPSTFPAGTKLTVKVHPMTNGTPVASFVAAKTDDGKIIGKWDAAAPQE
jgi:hypothetical protein